MIISASRRTDIPAFYAGWFMNRIRAGYCTVPKPFNRKQISRVSLKSEDVDVIVFWTCNPRPIFPYLTELDERDYRYYFQYTVMDNLRLIDPKTPPLETSLKTFRELAHHLGADRAIWRYDPIVFSQIIGAEFHRQTYETIAQALQGCTHRSVISIVDLYRKVSKRLRELSEQGVELVAYEGQPSQRFDNLMHALVSISAENGMEIVSCAEHLNLRPYGIWPGKCVDDEYIRNIFGLQVAHKKDPTQREACGCVVSRDIGMYDTCLFGCQYCYATTSFERAKVHYGQHDPNAPSLLSWYDLEPKSSPHQITLWPSDNL
jgi:hypothetical protein